MTEVYCIGCQITVKELDFILKHKPTRGMGETVTRALRKVCDVNNFKAYELDEKLIDKVCKHMRKDEGMEAVLVTEYGRKHKLGVHKTYLDMTNLICGTVLGACMEVSMLGGEDDNEIEFDEVLHDFKAKTGKKVRTAKSVREDSDKPTNPNQTINTDDDIKNVKDDVKTEVKTEDQTKTTTTTTATIDNTNKIDLHEEL